MSQTGQRHYQPRTGAASVSMPSGRGVIGMIQDWSTRERAALSGLTDLGHLAVKKAEDGYHEKQSADLAQRQLEYQRDLDQWRAEYEKTHQGRDAAEAARDFQDFAERRSREMREQIADPAYRDTFGANAAALGLRFFEQGQAYAAGQDRAYRRSVTDGIYARLDQDVADNIDNPDFIAFRRQLAARQLRDMNPGLDHAALDADVARRVAGAQLGVLVERGQLVRAREALNTNAGLMGTERFAWEAKIDARAEALRARAEAARKKAEAEAEKTALKGAVDGILAEVAPYPTLEEQKEAAFAMADALPNPTLRDKARTEIKQEMSWRETRRDAATAREKRQFQELARQQGWTPRQASDQLDKAEGLSERAREDLRNDFDGRAEKQSPTNKAALAELRTLIDRGPERGGIDPKDADAIDAYIYRHGLTYEQGRHAREYAEQGGLAGEVTQSQINRAFKALFPRKNAKDAPEDLFDLVGAELKRVAPGKAATDAEVRNVMARLYAEGETAGAGWFTWGVGKDETRMEALRRGRDEHWSPGGKVPAEDAARIESLLRESGVEPTTGRIRRYYWEEQGSKA